MAVRCLTDVTEGVKWVWKGEEWPLKLEEDADDARLVMHANNLM